jgi:hypothetical protein
VRGRASARVNARVCEGGKCERACERASASVSPSSITLTNSQLKDAGAGQ